VSPAMPGSGPQLDVPVANAEQASAWDGGEGAHWVAHQTRYEAMAPAFTERLLAAAALAEPDRVLDVGCGCGQTTRLAARQASAGHALGVDLSTAMVERARAQAADEGIGNARFERADAQVHPFAPEVFDVAISRFGIMFFDDPVAAFTNIHGALRPGGWITFVCWRGFEHNQWLAVPAGAALAHVPVPDLGAPDGPGPFSLAEPERVVQVLSRAGFDEISTNPVDAPVRLGRDADDAVSFLSGTALARTLLDPVDPGTAARALDAVRDALRPYERPDGLTLDGAAWLVAARRP
jgi:SAM-dependent methyltransferase